MAVNSAETAKAQLQGQNTPVVPTTPPVVVNGAATGKMQMMAHVLATPNVITWALAMTSATATFPIIGP